MMPVRLLSKLGLVMACSLAVANTWGHLGPIPPSLKGVPVPEVPGLLDGPAPIVVDREAAIVLGKALFWDTNVGSDGMACASCHFHAGADGRVKNQLAPGGRQLGGVLQRFDRAPDGSVRGPNYRLRRADFPFHRTTDPLNPVAPTTYSSDDVASSGGTFGGEFNGAGWFGGEGDACLRKVDPVFHVGATGTRRVEPRNTPSIINAVFNHRNLWDGRANNVFNGSSQWGPRDPDAGVWVLTAPGVVNKQRLSLPNSSLASQAVAPPLDDVEMACRKRVFADLGRKLLWRRPLERQDVHWADGVLGPFALSTPGNLRQGLNTFYASLIRRAFDSRYWAYAPRGEFGAPYAPAPQRALPYNQIEANFAMFFGLAIQLYQSTLVSDDSPFDRSARDAEGLPIGLSPDAQAGLTEFRLAHCNICHLGPTLSAAAIVTNAKLVKDNPLAFGNETFTVSTTSNVLTRLFVAKGASLVDTGFANTGVTPPAWDRGLGGRDAFNRPLSFATQYVSYLAGNTAAALDEPVRQVRPCDFQSPLAIDSGNVSALNFTRVDGIVAQPQPVDACFNPAARFLPTPAAAHAALANPASRKLQTAVDGAFKIPGLRNVELTGPYMHNGGMLNLEQVIEFYTRGGNVSDPSKQVGFVFQQTGLRFSPQKRTQILAFLKTLTDDRVRYERAPFDHPSLTVRHGHVGDHLGVNPVNPLGTGLAQDEFLQVPAVGAGGRDDPIGEFEGLLTP